MHDLVTRLNNAAQNPVCVDPTGLPATVTGLLREAAVEIARLTALDRAPGEELPLHPRTEDLVRRFTKALRDKLAAAEQKYGYRDGWADDDWLDECREKLREHIQKGDPRDVAAYCAFLWHHNASTLFISEQHEPATPPASPQSMEPAAPDRSRAMGWDVREFVNALSGKFFAEQKRWPTEDEIATAAHSLGLQQGRAEGVPEQMPAWFEHIAVMMEPDSPGLYEEVWVELRKHLTQPGRQSGG